MEDLARSPGFGRIVDAFHDAAGRLALRRHTGADPVTPA
jgi:hypothetical protein